MFIFSSSRSRDGSSTGGGEDGSSDSPSSTNTSPNNNNGNNKNNSISSNSSNSSEAGNGRRDGKKAERRESGRFPSASKILRSLSRTPRGGEDSSSTSSTLQRSNPHYHSEGKGLRKKNAWASERELPTGANSSKERSHSFCDKVEGGNHRRFCSSDVAPEKTVCTNSLLTAKQSMIATTLEPIELTSSPSTKRRFLTDVDKNHTSPEASKSIAPDHHQFSDKSLERDSRRSVRKLTKDSGYETSPYSESDYAYIENLPVINVKELESSKCGNSDEEDDDVTLAPDSDPTSEVSPSASPLTTTPTPSAR